MVNQYDIAFTTFQITLLLTLLQGLLLAFVRTKEPIYRFMMKREIISWFGELYNVETTRNDIRKNLAVQLLSSQLSIELVYTILFVVTEHTLDAPKTNDVEVFRKYDFSNKNEFPIDSLYIKNIDELTVGQSIARESNA